MEPLTYLHLQMRLEGIAVVDHHWMKQVETVPGEELPLMLIAKLASGELVTSYAEAIAPDLQEELSSIIVPSEFPKMDTLLDVLGSRDIHYEVGHYKTYVFPSRPTKDAEVACLSKHDPQVKAFGFEGFAENVYAIQRQGKVVSACVSARENEQCGEAWVYTDPAYRHQGFAQKVVNAWARDLIENKKVPFYSHKMENIASANLARKIGLQPVFEEITVTQI